MSTVRFAELDTPIGSFLVAWTDAGVAASSRGDLLAFLAALRRRFPERRIEPGESAGDLTTLPLDLTGISHFDARVYEAVRTIPYGATATYGEVAARIGAPGAARAVGGAMARCPFFPLVPCHRVVRASDGWSGWGGDASVKRRLLEAEATSSAWRCRPRRPRSPRASPRRRPAPC